MTDREREARIRERGTTHWEGCWRSHPRCAEARVEKLEARVERYREALEALFRDENEYGRSPAQNIENLVRVYGSDLTREIVSQRFAEIRRALNDGEDDG